MLLPLLLALSACVTDVQVGTTKTVTDTGDDVVDRDGDGFPATEGDCDDGNPDVYPDHSELCDGLDNNCDGEVDEGVKTTGYEDNDEDTWGDELRPVEACELPEGVVALAGDCDDDNEAIYPGAEEICDELDNDCDTLVDEDVQQTYYLDVDEDTYGDPDGAFLACSLPAGAVENDDDCDDTDETIYPGAPEACDVAIDANCDGSLSYADDDSDGWAACEDCDDTRPDAYPGAPEVCNSLDDDCDSLIDDDDPDVDLSTGTYTWADAATDSYGDPATGAWFCSPGSTRVSNDDDCDDTDRLVSPAGLEICNSIDDDCDTLIDDADPSVDTSTGLESWDDVDRDGHGDPTTGDWTCLLPSGSVTVGDDCDDAESTVYPGASEVCNSRDDDCDGTYADEVCSNTCFLNFTNAYTTTGYGTNPTTFYGAYGLTFSMSSGYGLVGGDAYGDPGNWSDVNTVPNPAWGLWDFGSNINKLTFSAAASNVSFTLERTAGGSDITVTVEGYLSGALVGSTTMRLTGATSIQTMTIPWTVDRLDHYLSAGNGFAYAIDDLEYDTTATCPP
jgi:hypothetical protein